MKKLSRIMKVSFLSLLLSAVAVQGLALSSVARAADEVDKDAPDEPSPPEPAPEKNSTPATPEVKQDEDKKAPAVESSSPEPAAEKNKKTAKPAVKKHPDKKATEKESSPPAEPAAKKNKKPAKPAVKQHQTKKAPTPSAKTSLTAEQIKQAIEKIEADMVAVNGGCFQMGSPATEHDRGTDEQQHKACVENFLIGKYEITQLQWLAVMDNNPSHFNGQNLPVENVSWQAVQDFIKKLNAKTGKTYRLPSETQWEYAARAGSTTAFYTGNCINPRQANYDGGEEYAKCGKSLFYNRQTVEVGAYQPNQLGLYDMAGNVWEWTCSSYAEHYDGSEIKCSDDAKALHVVRGGSWNFSPEGLRSANRSRGKTDDRSFSVGFRLTRL